MMDVKSHDQRIGCQGPKAAKDLEPLHTVAGRMC